MQIDKSDYLELANVIAGAVVTALKNEGVIGNNLGNTVGKTKVPVNEKSTYAKTEALLYNYRGFKKIVNERMKEIDDLRKYGVPQKCGAGGERVQGGSVPHGIVLPEESVEAAVRTVQESVQGTVQAILLIDKCMAAMAYDPYFRILEMYYFDGRTQEDIALEFNCDQRTVGRNKNRLVRELSMRIFPDSVMKEYME